MKGIRPAGAALRSVHLERDASADDWRERARRLLMAEVPPERVVWAHDRSLLCPGEGEAPAGPSPFDSNDGSAGAPPARPLVPAVFLEHAEAAACFRDDARWALLYRILWRLTHGEP